MGLDKSNTVTSEEERNYRVHYKEKARSILAFADFRTEEDAREFKQNIKQDDGYEFGRIENL